MPKPNKPSYTKIYFKWHCVKALIGGWKAKRIVENFFISANTSRSGGTKGKALQ